MGDLHDVIQPLLAPVVIISACGLLCMAQYNRLSAITARVRAFHHERLELFARLKDDDAERRGALRDRFEGVHDQACHLMERATLVRNALICLVSCIAAMLLASLAFGFAVVVPASGGVGIGLFVVGLLAMLVAMGFELFELSMALDQVRFEHGRVGRLTPSDPLPPGAPPPTEAVP